MNDTSAQRSDSAHKGLAGTLLSWAGKACAALVCSLFFSLITEWLGIAFFWPHEGAEHSRLLMNSELGWFADNVTRSLLTADPGAKLDLILQRTWQWVFTDSGFIPWYERLRNNPDHGWLIHTDSYIQATVYITLTFVLRVFILLLSAPLFLLAALTGVTDGLVRRDLRRFGCGYESGFVYHHARRRIMPVFFLSWMIYLSLPFSVNPSLILLPAAALFGLMISVSTGSFKKYL